MFARTPSPGRWNSHEATAGRVRNSKEPVPLFDVRREIKVHAMVYHLEGRDAATGSAQRLRYPYDRSVIVEHGYRLDNAIPPDPDEAEFPIEPWAP
jgi:hypothetical protein